MSPNNKQPKRIARRRAGLSLVELLVALAIFVTIMGGISALYGGAVRTVREGYKFIDNMETARAVLAALEDDLKTSFSAPQYGESYQFFGMPQGFMYVGTLPNGSLGRVTYALNPNASSQYFQTTIVEPYSRVRNRAESQVTRWARDNGLNPNTVWDSFRVPFEASYPIPVDSNGFPDLDRPTEFYVVISTQALLRLEEAGVSDLNTFDLSTLPSGPGTAPAYGIQWPFVDPREPAFDDPNGDAATTESAYEADLYAQLLTAVNPFAPYNIAFTNDLRELIRVAAFTQGQALNAAGPELVTQLIAAKRREIWIRMLAEDPFLGLPGYWNEGLVGDDRRERRDHIIADGILAQARLLASDDGTFLDALIPENNGINFPLLTVDAMDVPGMFSYGSSDGVFNAHFNAVQRVPGYTTFVKNAPNIAGDILLDDLDQAITEFLSGPRSPGETAGVPLTPQLPAMVQPGFWLMAEKATAGAADFRRWFVQVVDVPAGSTRSLPARFIANKDTT